MRAIVGVAHRVIEAAGPFSNADNAANAANAGPIIFPLPHPHVKEFYKASVVSVVSVVLIHRQGHTSSLCPCTHLPIGGQCKAWSVRERHRSSAFGTLAPSYDRGRIIIKEAPRWARS